MGVVKRQIVQKGHIINLCVQLSDESDGVSKLQRLCGHYRANRDSGHLTNLNGLFSVIALHLGTRIQRPCSVAQPLEKGL